MKNLIPPKALKVMALLRSAGARDVLIVGGFVRDYLIQSWQNTPTNLSKDIDIEIYGLPLDIINEVLCRANFQVDAVGKSFGVLKVDNELDISVPRRESKIGKGHRDFIVEPDPNMSIEDAARRRDFTINSMAMSEDGIIIDPFNGKRDLFEGKLRATSEAFKEDPLRVLRMMQFAARFGFQPTNDTIDMCIEMRHEFQSLPKERIWEEWKKFALRGRSACGITTLITTEWIDHFPELANMIDVQQDSQWHPEGPVWQHSVIVVQEAIDIANREQLDDEDRMTLFFAALCHDMGKPATTKFEDGHWRAKGHCEEGAHHAERFLESIGAPGWLIAKVKPLVVEHLVHAAGQPTERAVKRLARRLHPTNINMLSMLIESDHSGRPPLPKGNPFLPWVEMAKQLDLTTVQPMPILRGRDLINLGVKPGKTMGFILDKAFQAQLDGEFDCIEGAIAWYKSHTQK